MLDSTASTLDEVFRGVLELPPGTAVAGIRQESTEEWDSLAHVVLMSAIESAFEVQIDTADSLELTSYEAVAALLGQRGL